jgi:hypothetical protein
MATAKITEREKRHETYLCGIIVAMQKLYAKEEE